MFSKACEYAIRAVLFLAINGVDGKRVGITAIAKAIDSPKPFTAKILQKLVRAKVIASAKGPGGGFYLEDSMRQAPILRVVQAIDGPVVLKACILGLKSCSDKHPCPIHSEVKNHRDNLREALSKNTIQDLSVSLNQGKTFLSF